MKDWELALLKSRAGMGFTVLERLGESVYCTEYSVPTGLNEWSMVRLG